uniref:Uncharacterized protein n=1 Tax=Magallana gigas TaxID=29159 RepID=K1PNZ9_MAGGI
MKVDEQCRRYGMIRGCHCGIPQTWSRELVYWFTVSRSLKPEDTLNLVQDQGLGGSAAMGAAPQRPEWTAGKAIDGCDASRYSIGCVHTCPSKCSERCDAFNGACIHGCSNPNASSIDCIVCDDGEYITNKTCVDCPGHCKDEAPCNKLTGMCDNGCANQWTGAFCNSEEMPTTGTVAIAVLSTLLIANSDQHVDMSRSRMEKDNKDVNVLRDFLKERDQFVLHDKTLRNIETGMIADNDANADAAKSIGEKIIQSMARQLVSEISFKREDQVVPLDINETSNSNVTQFSQIDLQLMFQRLTAVRSETLNTTAELFQYELSSFPSSMFEANGLLKQAAKATLGEAIWSTGDCTSC